MCIAIGVISFLMIGLLVTFNSLVNYRNRPDSALSTTDVMLMRLCLGVVEDLGLNVCVWSKH